MYAFAIALSTLTTTCNRNETSTFLCTHKSIDIEYLIEIITFSVFSFQFGLTSQYCLKTYIEYFLYCTITITVKKPALFVYLEIVHPDIEKYRLSENGIILTDPIKVVQVEIELKSAGCKTLEKKHVRIMTINELLFNNKTPSNNVETDTPPPSLTTNSAITETLQPKVEENVMEVATDNMVDIVIETL